KFELGLCADDLGDTDAGIELAVAELAPVAHLRLVLEHDDLVALVVAQHLRPHGRAGDQRRAHGELALAVRDRQDLTAPHPAPQLCVDAVNIQHLAGADLVLLPAGPNNCVQSERPPRSYTSGNYSRARARASKSAALCVCRPRSR